jgi:hypothetical protein
MNTADKIDIMQAYLRGAELQMKGPKENDWSDWPREVCSDPTWTWGTNDYRIKPALEFVPLGPDDINLAANVVYKHRCDLDQHSQCRIGSKTTHVVWMSNATVGISFAELRANYMRSFDGGKTWEKCEKKKP